MRRRGRALVVLAACLAALTVTACGGDDYENDPRPPTPAEISIQIADDDITVSPAEFGAGIANFTIVNLGDVPTAVEIAEISGAPLGASEEIAPSTSAVVKVELESGDYEATATDLDIDPFVFAVGPERESANNELLLP
jgi:hypothetical protein